VNEKIGLLGKKVGMTHIFEEDGTRVPVTVVDVSSNVVTAHRTAERDGYTALQLGFDEQKASRVNKPDLGRFKKADTTPRRFLRELRVDAAQLEAHPVGSKLEASLFEDGATVDVTGTSKGKGFQGVIKRHGMRGEKRSHGQHEVYRHGGSIGCRLTPGRVIPGKRMAGQMGNERVTIQNLRVARVMPDEGVLLIRGPIPGGTDGYVTIRHAVKGRAE
jgi:large subunit ribosomal protein L3